MRQLIMLFMFFICLSSYAQIGKWETSTTKYNGPYPTAPNRLENLLIGGAIGYGTKTILVNNFSITNEHAWWGSCGVTLVYAGLSEWREAKQFGSDFHTCNFVMKSTGAFVAWMIENICQEVKFKAYVRNKAKQTVYLNNKIQHKYQKYKINLVVNGVNIN